MKNSRLLRLAATVTLVSACTPFSHAGTAADVAQAAALVQRMVELNQKFSAYDLDLPAPAPLAGAKGKFLLPIDENGALTGWAQKAINAQVGNVAGEQAGGAAAKGLGAIVPGGGLASGFLKKKGKESGAMLALGGADYVKQTSSLSFDSVESYAVYLHAKAGKSADYSKAVQAAIALYPDLEKTYSASVSAAYDLAIKDSLAKKAAIEALAAKEKAEKDKAYLQAVAEGVNAARQEEKAQRDAAAGTTTTTTVTTTTVTTTPAAAVGAPVVAPVATTTP